MVSVIAREKTMNTIENIEKRYKMGFITLEEKQKLLSELKLRQENILKTTKKG